MYSSLGGKHKADHNAFALDGRCERQNVVSLGAQRKKKVGSNHEDLKKKQVSHIHCSRQRKACKAQTAQNV